MTGKYVDLARKNPLTALVPALAIVLLIAQAVSAQEFDMAMKYYKAGQYQRAAQLFEMAMRRRPDNSVALVNDAVCYHKLGEIERARALYMHVLAIFPDQPAANIARDGLRILPAKNAAPPPAPEASTSANTAAASKTKQLSLAEIPTQVSALLSRASAFHEAGRYNECQNTYADALNLAEKLGPVSPSLADVLRDMANYRADLKEYEAAAKYNTREIKLRELLLGRRSRPLIDVWMRMAPNYLESGDLDTAETYYRDSLPTFQKEYEDAVRSRKRLTGERDRYLNCLNGLSSVLKKRAIPHPSATHDEYDDLQVLIKQLQDEAKKPQRL